MLDSDLDSAQNETGEDDILLEEKPAAILQRRLGYSYAQLLIIVMLAVSNILSISLLTISPRPLPLSKYSQQAPPMLPFQAAQLHEVTFRSNPKYAARETLENERNLLATLRNWLDMSPCRFWSFCNLEPHLLTT